MWSNGHGFDDLASGHLCSAQFFLVFLIYPVKKENYDCLRLLAFSSSLRFVPLASKGIGLGFEKTCL